jgi:hypothetical protein
MKDDKKHAPIGTEEERARKARERQEELRQEELRQEEEAKKAALKRDLKQAILDDDPEKLRLTLEAWPKMIIAQKFLKEPGEEESTILKILIRNRQTDKRRFLKTIEVIIDKKAYPERMSLEYLLSKTLLREDKDIEFQKFLLKKGANPNVVIGGFTLLETAIMSRHLESVNLILKSKIMDPNIRTNNGTALHCAINSFLSGGDGKVKKIVNEILKCKGLDLSIKNNKGLTVIDIVRRKARDMTDVPHKKEIDKLLNKLESLERKSLDKERGATPETGEDKRVGFFARLLRERSHDRDMVKEASFSEEKPKKGIVTLWERGKDEAGPAGAGSGAGTASVVTGIELDEKLVFGLKGVKMVGSDASRAGSVVMAPGTPSGKAHVTKPEAPTR